MKTRFGEPSALPGIMFFALSPVALVLSHQTVTYTVLPLALAAVLLAGRLREAVAFLLRPLPAAILAFGLLALVSAAWAPDASRAASEGTMLICLTVVLSLFAGQLTQTEPGPVSRLQRILLAAFFAAAALLALQIWGGFLIKWELAGKDYMEAVARNNQNVGSAGLVILLWPALFLLVHAAPARPARRLAAAGALVLMATAVFLGRGIAPKAVLLVGTITFILAAWRPAATALLAGGAIVAVTVALMFVPSRLYGSADFMEIPWLDTSSKYRIEIWDLASRWARERPLLGHGAGASRALPPLAEISRVHGGVRRIPMYPHNVMVQTALELGLAGVLCAWAICGLMLRALLRLPPPMPPYALAVFVSAVGIWFIGYPLWRSAWVSWLGFCVLGVVLAARAGRPESACSGS